MSFRSAAEVFFIFFVFVFVMGFLVYGSQLFLSQSRTAGLSDVSGAVSGAIRNFPERDWQVQDLDINAASAGSGENDPCFFKILFF